MKEEINGAVNAVTMHTLHNDIRRKGATSVLVYNYGMSHCLVINHPIIATITERLMTL